MNLPDIHKSLQQKIKNLKLPRDAAGHHLTHQVPLALTTETIETVRNRIFHPKTKLDTINYIYVLSKNQTLRGVLSINELLQAKPTQKLSQVMNTKLTVSHPQADQERIAHLALKHNIKAIPIIDHKNRFVGVVPSDQILKILNEEVQEDIYKNVGIIPPAQINKSKEAETILHAFGHRVPWIIIGLFGGLAGAQIVNTHQPLLERNLLLAAFMPLVVYISSAVGTQTQTLFVRDLALEPKLDVTPYFLRQISIASLIAVVCGLLATSLMALFWQAFSTGLVIGFAILMAATASTLVAIGVPYVLSKTGNDPANGSGPFGTILLDLMSLTIYFTTATLLL